MIPMALTCRPVDDDPLQFALGLHLFLFPKLVIPLMSPHDTCIYVLPTLCFIRSFLIVPTLIYPLMSLVLCKFT